MVYGEISFRRLEEEDLGVMHEWLNRGMVMEWYNKGGCSLDEVVDKYLPRIKGEQPILPYIIVYNGIDIGYIQMYLIESDQEYCKAVNVDISAGSIDLFIGEEKFIHRGLGRFILREFLRNYLFEEFDVGCCIIGPEVNNKIAIRAYEKAGFRYLKTVDVPDEDEQEYLMILYRDELMI